MKTPCFHNLSVILCLLVALGLVGVAQAQKVKEKNYDRVIKWGTCGYTELTTFLHDLIPRHSNIARLGSIGKSVEGRDLWVVVISDQPFERPLLRPQIKYVGNIIGNYGPSCYLLLRLIKHLLTTFSQEDSLERRLIEMNEIHILPNLNPDGFIRSISGACSGGHGRYNAAGFDLNRDFPDVFNNKEGKSKQPETQAVMKWIQSNYFLMSISIMSGALVVSYPYDSVPIGSSMTGVHATPDDDMFVHLAMTYVKNINESAIGDEDKERICPAVQRNFPNGIVNGAEWSHASGTMLDYNYVQGTFEIMVGVSCCRNENDPLALDRIWEINKQALVGMANETDYGLRGQVIDAETHAPIFNASLTKRHVNADLDDRKMSPMPWRTTSNGEFWRLILPGKYILEVQSEGYDMVRIPFEVNIYHFTKLLVELEVTKSVVTDPVPAGGTDSSALDFNGVDSMSLNISQAQVNVSESKVRTEPSYSKYNSSHRSANALLPNLMILEALAIMLVQW